MRRTTFATVLLLTALTAGCTAAEPEVYGPVTRPPVAEDTTLDGTVTGFGYYPDSSLPETPFGVDVATEDGPKTLRFAEAASDWLELGDAVTIADGKIIEVNGEQREY
jgi:hypothetical protein